MTLLKKPPLAALTSLRFLAALAIVIHHCNGVFWPAMALGPLDAGVSFFFVLSGFILTYVYRDLLAGAGHWQNFYQARIARIWPLHLVCLLLTLLLVSVPEPFRAGVLMANVLLLHAWIPFDRYFFSYNYVSWSISTELFFYLVMPLLLVAARRRQRNIVLALALTLLLVLGLAALSSVAGLLVWQTSHDHLSSTGLLYANPLARLAEFLAGMMASLVFMPPQPANQPGSRRLRLGWTLAELLSVVLMILAYRYFLLSFAPAVHEVLLSAGATRLPLVRLADESALLGQISPLATLLIDEWANHVGLTPFAVLLIAVFARQGGVLSQALSQRWLVFLGEISFALYLVHQVALRVWQQQGLRGDWTGFWLFLAMVMFLAWALHAWIEKPARRWLGPRIDVP